MKQSIYRGREKYYFKQSQSVIINDLDCFNDMLRRRTKTQMNNNDSSLSQHPNPNLKEEVDQLQKTKWKLKIQLSQQRVNLQSLHGKVQKKIFEIFSLQNQSNALVKSIGNLLTQMGSSHQRTSFDLNSLSEEVVSRIEDEQPAKSITSLIVKQLYVYKQEHDKKWNNIAGKTKQKHELLENVRQQKLQIKNTEIQLENIKQVLQAKIHTLAEIYYSEIGTHDIAIIDIVQKIVQLKLQFDPQRFPKNMELFEKQYILSKVNMQLNHQSTELLDHQFIEQLKIKFKQQLLINRELRPYLRNLFGKNMQFYLTRLQDNRNRRVHSLPYTQQIHL